MLTPEETVAAKAVYDAFKAIEAKHGPMPRLCAALTSVARLAASRVGVDATVINPDDGRNKGPS